jgi:hypothetical protein
MNRLYIKKEYLLMAGTLLACLACYQLAFKRTVAAWQLNQQLKARLAQSSDVSNQPGYTARKNANLDRVLELYQADSINFRSNTISQIAQIAEAGQVKLAEVPYDNQVYANSWFLIQKLDFEGDYFSLMRVFQQLEQRHEAGIIRSAAFRAKRGTDPEKEKKIVMVLYFESIK